jgi:predicted HicB family RNase H-like nuclease
MVQLNVRISSELQRRLKLLAVRLDLPLQTLVESILTESIYEWEHKADA